MNEASELFLSLGRASAQWLLNPFYYIAVIMIVLQYRRQIYLERKLFHTRLHSLGGETLRSIGWGLAGGLAASLLLGLIGASLAPEAVYWIWGAALLGVLFRMRFLCIAYATGLIAVLQYASSFIDSASAPNWMNGWMNSLLASLQSISMSSLLAFVAVLHLIEGLLIRFQGKRMMTPLFLEGKRGKIVGGYQLQGFWPVPLFMFLPLSMNETASWTSMLNGELWSGGWQLAALPVMIGFLDLTKTRTPNVKLQESSLRLILYSVVVFALAVAAELLPSLSLLAGLLCLLLHEALIYWSYNTETKGSALFVHDAKGLRILGIMPNSPAEQLGIRPGEIIARVNDKIVRTKEDLHTALRMNPAFCKLEIIDLNGENRFLQRAMFAGENYQLGILLSPDDEAEYYLEFEQPKSIFAYVRLKLTGLFQNERRSENAANLYSDDIFAGK